MANEKTESVEIRKSLFERARACAKKYPVFYDSVEELVEVGVRNEIVAMEKMER